MQADLTSDVAADHPLGQARAVLSALRDHWHDPLYKNSYFLMLNTVIFTGSGFVFWLIAARLAPPAQVGIATATVSAVMLISIVSKLGFEISILQRLPRMDTTEARELIGTAFALSGILSVAVAVVFVVGSPIWSPKLSYLQEDLVPALVFVVLAYVWSQGTLIDSVFTAKRRSDLVLYKNTLQAVLKIAMLIVLTAPLLSMGITISALGSMLPALLLGSLIWFPRLGLGRRLEMRPRPSIIIGSGGTFAANCATSIAMLLPLAVGSLIVLQRLGPEAAALFYIIWMFGSLGLIAPMAFGRSGLVEIAHTKKMGNLMGARPLAISILAGVGVLIAGVALMPRLGAHYAVGIVPLLPFVLATIPGSMFHAQLAVLRAAERHRIVVASVAIVQVVFLGGLLVFPLPVVEVGWLWLAAMTAGALVGWPFRNNSEDVPA